jgi:hypothetical protein
MTRMVHEITILLANIVPVFIVTLNFWFTKSWSSCHPLTWAELSMNH